MSKAYDVVLDKVLSLMDNGILPWEKPWNSVQANLSSRRLYNGMNIFILEATQAAMGYNHPWWATYKQVNELGGRVRKGEHSTPVVFWTFLPKKDDDGNPTKETFPYLRYYSVFNADQCDWPEGFEIPDSGVENFQDIEALELVISNYVDRTGIRFEHGGTEAFHSLELNLVRVPNKQQFETEQHYYKTVLHELAHSTRHPDRLNRPKNWFEEHSYSKEELVAEMAAAMLAGMFGFTDEYIVHSAAYIKGWARAFEDDKRMVVSAATQARKAANYILNVKDTQEEE